jgi:transcriptional regulator with XRE-family HTH domain
VADLSERTNLHRDLSAAVRRAANEADMTQALLATRAGLSEKHVSRMLKGRDVGTLDAWDRLAVGLGKRWSVDLA